MAVPSYDKDRIQPGYDRAEVESCLESLFDQLAEQYPDRTIIWSTWDHENWDRPAKHLCRALGYSRGKELFNAFGYDVVDGVAKEKEEEPVQTEEMPAETEPAEETEGEEPAETEDSKENTGDGDEESEAEKPAQIYAQKTIKRRNRNRITIGQILFILLFLATVFGVYWIVNFG